MEFKELIKERRSFRSYREGESISNELIADIVKDAQLAPSWKNSQTARYYVANTPEALDKVREGLPEFNRNSSKNAALVVTTFQKDVSGFAAGQPENELSNKWGAYDLGLANSYFILSAKEHGLDTLIMGIRDAGKLREVLDIPKTEQIVAVIALGYGEGNAFFKERKDTADVLKFI